MGRWPRQGPEGALPFCLLPAAALQNRFAASASAGSRLPPGGVVGSRPDSRPTFLRGQESRQRTRQGASAGPLDPRRLRSRLAPARAPHEERSSRLKAPFRAPRSWPPAGCWNGEGPQSAGCRFLGEATGSFHQPASPSQREVARSAGEVVPLPVPGGFPQNRACWKKICKRG